MGCATSSSQVAPALDPQKLVTGSPAPTNSQNLTPAPEGRDPNGNIHYDYNIFMPPKTLEQSLEMELNQLVIGPNTEKVPPGIQSNDSFTAKLAALNSSGSSKEKSSKSNSRSFKKKFQFPQ